MASLTVSHYLGMLQRDPLDRAAFDGLSEAIQSGDAERTGESPLRLLEAARAKHERRGEAQAVAWLIELQQAISHDDPDFRFALLKELGRLRREELLEPEAATEAYRMALEVRPGDASVEQALEELEQMSERWRQIADRFVEEAQDASDATVRTSFLVRAGCLVWEYRAKGKAREADKLFRDALRSDPGDVRAARLYCVTLRARDKAKDEAGVLSQTADAARGRDDKLNLYLAAARLYSRKLEQPDNAAQAYRRVLEFAPGHDEAMSFLVAHYTEAEDWDSLVGLYEDALRSRQKLEQERGILLQLGMVHWRIRQQPDAAEPYFGRLRKIDPGNAGMLAFYREYLSTDDQRPRLLTILADAQRAAGGADEKLTLAIELARQASETDATVERAIDAWKAVQRIDANNLEARAALTDLYRRAEKWNALVEVMRAEIDALGDDEAERKVVLLRELVPIYRDHLALETMVVHTYNAILELAPDDLSALAVLGETYEAMGRHNDLIQVLMRRADATEDTAEKVELLERVAHIWLERFANYNQATKPLEAILEVQPDNLNALAQLRTIYSKKRAYQPLYGVLEKELALATDPAAALELKVELARLAGDRLHRQADAIALWAEIVDEAPETEGALASLEKLAEREKDWPSLARALEVRVKDEADPKERVRELTKLGGIYAEHLDAPERAASAFQRILAVDPKNGRAMRTLREAYVAAGDFASLEALYAERDDWEGLVDVLGTAAERTEDNALKVQLSFRAADIYRERIGEAHRAFRNYERILSVEPKNQDATRALIPIYERDEKWSRLVGLYEVLLAGQTEDTPMAERLEQLYRLSDLCLTRLGDAGAAFGWARSAYAIAPTDPTVLARLEAVAAQAGAWEPFMQVLRGRVDATEDDEERTSLRRRMATVAADRLGKPAEAAAQLEAILVQSPGDAETARSLAGIYRSEGQFEPLSTLLSRQLEQSKDRDTRRALLRELSELRESMLADPDGAADAYRALLQLDSTDSEALSALDRLAREAGRWDELGSVLRRRVELASGSEAVALRLGLADVLATRLEDGVGAEACYAALLEAEPANAEAAAGLEGLRAADPSRADAIGRILEPAYEARLEYGKLSELLAARLLATTDEEEKRDLNLRLADLAATELGDPAAAYAALESAFLDRPEDDSIWGRLSIAADAAEMHQALATAFATAIEAGDLSDRMRAELARRLAEIYDVVLGKSAAAEPYHKIALAADPLDERAFLALKELYTEGERWDELQLLYRNRIAETLDGDQKLDLLLQVCFLFEELLDDPELAIRSYQDVLQLDPEHAASRRALDRLYRRTQRFRDLVALMGQELERVEGQDALEITFALGEIYEQRLADPRQAVDCYERVLETNPTHLRSQEALERLSSEPSQRQRIASILEPLYDGQGAWAELSRMLEIQLEDVSDVGTRVGLSMRIARLREDRLHDLDGAFAAVASALTGDPADPGPREELARLAAIRDSQRERAEVLERAVKSVEDSPYVAAELLLELARVWDDSVGDAAKAESAYTRLIAVDPDNAEPVVAASRALERLHLAAERYDALADDLERQARFEPEPEARGGLLLRLAELYESTLDDIDHAIAAHRRRLDDDPTDVAALTALERLYTRGEQWQKLIGVLSSMEQASDEVDEQRRLCRRVGTVFEQRLGDVENAIVAYNEVLGRFGADAETLDALGRLYRKSERWYDLLEVLETRIEQTEEADEAAELRFSAAELMRLHTGDVERAIETYGEVLAVRMDHTGAVNALEEILTEPDGEFRSAAARVLVPLYEGRTAWSELIDALEVQAEGQDTVERLNALRRAAEVAEMGLEDSARAFELLGEALPSAMGEPDLATLLADYRRLAQLSEKHAAYVARLREICPGIYDADVQTEVLMGLAEVSRDRLEDPAAAREFLEKVLETRPDHRPALDALEALHTASGDYAALLRVLRRQGEISDSAQERANLLMRQAEICEQHTDSPREAIEALEEVLVDGPRADAYVALARLYTKTEQWTELAALYERQLDELGSQGGGDEAALRYALGRLRVEHLDDAYAAVDDFRAALARDPGHAESIAALQELMATDEHRGAAAEILEGVFLAKMDWPNVTGALEARLLAETSLDGRKLLLQRLGEIHEDYLEDLEGALETYARLFHEDPRDPDVWETLSRLARVLDRWVRLADIYAAALGEIGVDDPETAKLAFTAARLFDEKGGDPRRAAPLYRSVLSFDPTDTAAFDALREVLERTNQWDALLALYRERAQVAESDTERGALLRRAAQLQEERLGDAEGAIDTWREALEVEPSSREAAEARGRLLAAAERWEELAEHLAIRVDETESQIEVLGLKFTLAELMATRLADESGAIDLLEEIVQADPDHAQAIELLEKLVVGEDHRLRITRLLEPLYRAADQWRKLVAVLEAQAELASDPAERAQLLAEVGRMHEERGSDPERALDAYSRAFVAEPHDEVVRGEIDRLAASLEAWDGWIRTYEEALAGLDDPSLGAALLSAMARVHDEHRGDPRAAITTYERLVELDPDDTSGLDMLDALHTMVGDWRGLVDVLRRKTERCFDPTERAELLRRAGSVLEELLGDPEAAVETYRRATEEDDTDAIAYEALDRLYSEQGRREELAEVLGRRIEVEEDVDTQVEVGLRLAALLETQLGRPHDAIDALTQVLARSPGRPEAVEGLGRLYERQAMWPELLENLEFSAGMAETVAGRVGFMHRMGELLERDLDDVPEAIERYRQALELDSHFEPAVAALIRISQLEDYRESVSDILEPLVLVQERWDDLAGLVQRRAESTTDPLKRAAQLKRLAQIREDGCQDDRAAFQALLRALAEDASDEEILVGLARLANALDAQSELADALHTRATSCMDPMVSRSLYMRLAELAEEKLADPARAIEAYVRAAEQVGDDEEILAALDRLYATAQSYSELAEVLERRIQLSTDPSMGSELTIRLGRLRQEHFQDLRGAFAAFQEVLERDPNDLRALSALEGLTASPELALEVVEVLDRAYRDVGAADKVVGLYDVRIEMAESDGERVHLLREAAALWEREIGDLGKALACLRKAFSEDPRETDLLDELERLAEASGEWESLRGLVKEAGARSEVDRDLRRDLNMRAAGWYRDRLADAAAAEACLREAIEADPDASAGHEALVDLLAAAGREAELLAAQRAWAAVEIDPETKKARLLAAARLAESALGDVHAAAECLDGALAVDPQDPYALEELARLREGQGRFSEVAELLTRRIEVEDSADERVALLRRLADLYRGPLGDVATAIATYLDVLEAEPGDASAQDALEQLYEDAERWEDLRELLETRLAESSQDDVRIALRVRLASLSEKAFGRPEEALHQLQEILSLDPTHVEAQDELLRLLSALQRWDDLAETLSARAEREPDQAMTYLARLAELHLTRRKDAAAARATYERILTLEADHRPTLEALLALHREAADASAEADVLERLLALQTGDEAVQTALTLAQVAEEKLKDPARAEAALLRAHGLEGSASTGGASQTGALLLAHYERHGEKRKLAELLAAGVESALEVADKVELLKRVSHLYSNSLEDPATAAHYLEQAASLQEGDREILLPLCDLYIAAGRQADAVPVLEQIIESFGGRRHKELAQYHHRLGRALEGMGDADGAMKHLEAAFRIDLTSVPILRDLGRIRHERGDFAGAQKTFRALLLQKLKPEDGITKADVYYYLGDIAASEGDPRKARSMLERAVAEDRDHALAAAKLAELSGG